MCVVVIGNDSVLVIKLCAASERLMLHFYGILLKLNACMLLRLRWCKKLMLAVWRRMWLGTLKLLNQRIGLAKEQTEEEEVVV